MPDSKRARFSPDELAAVLDHYDLGVIDRMHVYPRGSRRAPKVRITSAKGDFLLKRRAPGHDNPYRVAFAHGVQLFLAERGIRVAPLVGTRENNSLLQFEGCIYEMFRHVRGHRCSGSVEQSHSAGVNLGRMHTQLRSFDPAFDPPIGGYHAPRDLSARLTDIPAAIAAVESDQSVESLTEQCRRMDQAYHEAARRVAEAGYRDWPRAIVHGDWHPGNLLFDGDEVVAILDFDSARLEPPAAELANAILQFSMTLSARDDPEKWPEGLAIDKMAAVMSGYCHDASHTIAEEVLVTLPWLMIEALIVETAVPIAATGRFGQVSGSRFLSMVLGKLEWVARRQDELIDTLRTAGRPA